MTLALLDRLGLRPPARVLDAGCGWGVTLEALERRGYRAVGMDISRQALEMLDRPGRELIEADLTRPLPEGVAPFDAVLALDVIEHLDDDRAAVVQLGRLARPGGVVVISVPALPELFTEFDAIQGHRRRYRPETLRQAFAETGLVVERLFWWSSWLVPLLRWQRRRPRRAVPGESASQVYSRYLRLPPWPVPWAFRIAFALEQGPTLAGKLTIGTSLFAVARRPMGDEANSIGRVT
ncbi:MAG: class I SAM-dependent methyltransferase [Isosphaeraceae bacterium]|nr:class I SAM-dependent methyltransferase [Isosphaeraceae bacterium]